MRRVVGILLACLVTTSVFGIDGAGADDAATTAEQLAAVLPDPPAAEGLEPRSTVATPWGKDDTVGDAERPEGDLRRIIVENGRVQMHFMFRTVQRPLWDTAATDRLTGMVFSLDWEGTTAAPNRQIVVLRDDGIWVIGILTGRGRLVCERTGGVRQLTNNRFTFSAPVQGCLGGAHVVRASGGLVDDLDDTAEDDLHVDFAPNGGGYGPFIRLP